MTGKWLEVFEVSTETFEEIYILLHDAGYRGVTAESITMGGIRLKPKVPYTSTTLDVSAAPKEYVYIGSGECASCGAKEWKAHAKDCPYILILQREQENGS